MQCPEYQLDNREEAKFCNECGADGWVGKYEKKLGLLS